MELEEAFNKIWTHTKKAPDNYGKITGIFSRGNHTYDIEIFSHARSYVSSEGIPDVNRKTEVSITHYDEYANGTIDWNSIKTDTEYFYNIQQIEVWLREKWRIRYWTIDWRTSYYS